MKSSPPSLSIMAMPVTTSNCITTRPVSSSSSSRLETPSETIIAPPEKQTHVSTTSQKKKHTPIVPTPKPTARFSTGVTAVEKVVASQPPASLSLLPPFQQQQQQQQHQPTPKVTVYKPLQPPRVPPSSLSSILLSETNLESFQNDENNDGTTSSSNSNDWLQLSNRNSDWTQLPLVVVVVKDCCTLIALNVLRVFLVQGTAQVFVKRAVFRALKTWQRQEKEEYPNMYNNIERNILSASSSSSSRAGLVADDDWTVRGIVNFGQTCFMNSVLQALTSMPIVLTYLHQVVQLQYATTTTTTSKNNNKRRDKRVSLSLCENLWKLLQSLQHASMPMVDARIILQKVSSQNAQFQNNGGGAAGEQQQQDAQEFLQALLGVVIQEAQLHDSKTKLSSLESSILSSTSEDEFLSLAAFLNRIHDEQLSLANSLLEEDNAEASSFNRDDTQDKSAQQQNGHGITKIANSVREKKEHDENHAIEEKKQEDFEHAHEMASISNRNVPSLPTKREESSLLHDETLYSSDITSSTAMSTSTEMSSSSSSSLSFSSNRPQMSASTRLMLQTLSPSTPSPLSGWLGSTLQCCSCHHVRPIQNAPFLDIPIVPLSVSHYMSVRGGMKQHPSQDTSSCSLTDCLREFTSVERVHDVECRNCTIRQDIAQLEEEVFMLQGAIQTITARRKSDQVEGLQSELARAEAKLTILRQVNPDDGDDGLDDLSASMDEIDFGVETKRKGLKRGTAKKCLLFTRLPNVLCLHVQRRYYDSSTQRMAKTRQHVAFPEVLDLSPFCAYGGGKEGMPLWAGSGSRSMTSTDDAVSRRSSGKLYRLMSVIEHCGNAFSGHYQTYRRVEYGDVRTDRWVLISDENVTPVRWEDVRMCQAYMLFYEAL